MSQRFLTLEGDLFTSKETYLCHQCNCVSSRSAHLSSAVFKKYPYADVYTGRTRSNPDTPGTIKIRGNGADQRYVINLFGQMWPGKKYPNDQKDGREARAKFFNSCLNHMADLPGTFAFPWRIGCGAAGGDWDRYLRMLENFSYDVDGIVIYRLPGAR